MICFSTWYGTFASITCELLGSISMIHRTTHFCCSIPFQAFCLHTGKSGTSSYNSYMTPFSDNKRLKVQIWPLRMHHLHVTYVTFFFACYGSVLGAY